MELHRERRSEDAMVSGIETILLVDDEKMVIEVGQAMLKKLGYRSAAAEGGKQAIDIVRQIGGEIDLVILDMMMPDMDGEKSFDLIRELNPENPVILSSGYSLDGQAANIINKTAS